MIIGFLTFSIIISNRNQFLFYKYTKNGLFEGKHRRNSGALYQNIEGFPEVSYNSVTVFSKAILRRLEIPDLSSKTKRRR